MYVYKRMTGVCQRVPSGVGSYLFHSEPEGQTEDGPAGVLVDPSALLLSWDTGDTKQPATRCVNAEKRVSRSCFKAPKSASCLSFTPLSIVGPLQP